MRLTLYIVLNTALKYKILDKVWRLTRLLLVPATSATAEHSFSALRLLETYMYFKYLRATMGQPRLNSLLILHCHQVGTDRGDKLNLKAISQEFVHVTNEF